MRRTFDNWTAEAGVGELTTCALMGHSSSEMVRRVYAQLSDRAGLDAVARLPRIADGGTK